MKNIGELLQPGQAESLVDQGVGDLLLRNENSMTGVARAAITDRLQPTKNFERGQGHALLNIALGLGLGGVVIGMIKGGEGSVDSQDMGSVAPDLDQHFAALDGHIASAAPSLIVENVFDGVQAGDLNADAGEVAGCYVPSEEVVKFDENGKAILLMGHPYSMDQLVSAGVKYRFCTSKDSCIRVKQPDGCGPVVDNFVFEGFYQAPSGDYYMIDPSKK